jgi:hypothetical protein
MFLRTLSAAAIVFALGAAQTAEARTYSCTSARVFSGTTTNTMRVPPNPSPATVTNIWQVYDIKQTWLQWTDDEISISIADSPNSGRVPSNQSKTYGIVARGTAHWEIYNTLGQMTHFVVTTASGAGTGVVARLNLTTLPLAIRNSMGSAIAHVYLPNKTPAPYCTSVSIIAY